MNEVNNKQNLNAHYSSETKVKRPVRIATTVQKDLYNKKLFDDKAANQRIVNINNDIYVKTHQEKRRERTNFAKWFAGFVLAIVGFIGIKRFFK